AASQARSRASPSCSIEPATRRSSAQIASFVRSTGRPARSRWWYGWSQIQPPANSADMNTTAGPRRSPRWCSAVKSVIDAPVGSGVTSGSERGGVLGGPAASAGRAVVGGDDLGAGGAAGVVAGGGGVPDAGVHAGAQAAPEEAAHGPRVGPGGHGAQRLRPVERAERVLAVPGVEGGRAEEAARRPQRLDDLDAEQVHVGCLGVVAG